MIKQKSEDKDKQISSFLSHLNEINNDDEIQAEIASMITNIENLGVCENLFAEFRVKTPVSALIKTQTNPKYTQEWNAMKDILGMMLVVDNNDQVDQLLQYFKDNYSHLQNPNAKNFFEDYRKHSIRESKDLSKKFVFQDPTGRNYQTTDGFKSTKVNMMLFDNIPLEIQIKTLPQYIAHMCTHESAYKDYSITDSKERFELSDKLFPYFETFAYLELNRDKMTAEEIKSVEKDITDIFERNRDTYSKYADIFNESRAQWAVVFYYLKHKKEFIQNSINVSSKLNKQITFSKIRQVYEYYFDKVSLANPSLFRTQIVNIAANKLLNSTYEEVVEIRKKHPGKYRNKSCTLMGIFDVLKPEDIETLRDLSEVYREITVGIISDKLASSYLGKPPVYNQEERCKLIESLQNVTGSFVVTYDNLEFAASPHEIPTVREPLGPVQFFDTQDDKKYDLAYVSGVMDGFHPGHLEHLQTVMAESKEVYVGVKSDEYSLRVKNKLPVSNENDRFTIVSGIRGVDKAKITNCDILPSHEFFDRAKEIQERGGKVAIFMGSDWFTKRETKPQSSLAEYYYITKNFPEFILTTTTRNGELSSTKLRKKLVENKEDAKSSKFNLELIEK